MIGVWLFAAIAQANPCAPIPAAQFEAALDRLDGALAEGKLDVVGAVALDAYNDAPCVDRVVAPSEVARLAHAMAVVRFSQQDEVEAIRWAQAAEAAFPGYPWPAAIGLGHPLRALVARAPEPGFERSDRFLAPPKDGAVFVDGRFATRAEARSDLPVLVQVWTAAGRSDGWWQDGGSFPDLLLGPGPAPAAPAWLPAPEDAAKARSAADARYGAPAVTAAQKFGCQPLDAAGFVRRVDDAARMLDADNLVGFGIVYKQLRADIPCLAEPIPGDDWARFLVDLATVEFATGQQWTEPLSTALLVFPSVSRDRAPPALAAFVPATAPVVGSVPLPVDARFYLDGREIKSVPELTGLHLLQREQDGRWETEWSRNAAFPTAWLPVEVAPDVEVKAGLTFTAPPSVAVLVAGFGRAGQHAEAPGDYVGTSSGSGLAASLASVGRESLGPVPAYWDVLVGIDPAGLEGEAFGGVSLGRGPVLDLGLGAVSSTVVVDGEAQQYAIFQTRVGVAVGVPLGDPATGLLLDAGVAGGLGLGGANLRLRVGLADGGEARLGWYGGLEVADDLAWFGQEGFERAIGASSLRVAARGGLRF